MSHQEDPRIVMTLDAGGSNLVFSAISRGQEIITPVSLPSSPDCLDTMLKRLVEGFSIVEKQLPEVPSAISFAFPGPADYPSGIIGDLPNLPAFRGKGGVALGPFLQDCFRIPVFINNDGDLFAYGEALTGVLPEINRRLKEAGSLKQYRNLIGITIGTGFGAGIVVNNRLHTGDNAAGGDIYPLRNKRYPHLIIEESVSIRAVKRVYAEHADTDATDLTPKDIYEIAAGTRPGNRYAALRSFEELGEMAGDALCSAATLIDGLIVIGGGIANASQFFMPALLREMNSQLAMKDGTILPRMQMRVFNLDDEAEFREFALGKKTQILVPGSNRIVDYDPMKRIGIVTSKQDTSRSISLGAYIYALNNL